MLLSKLRVHSFDPGRVVPFGDGTVAAPERFAIEAEADEIPYIVDLEVVFDGERFECEKLTVTRKPGGEPVTSEGIRQVPVRTVIRAAASRTLYRRTVSNGVVQIEPYEPSWDVAESGPTADALEAVAAIYHLAYAFGDPPTKAVAASLDLPRSTAGYWVAKARDRGLLTVRAPHRPRAED